MTRNALQSAAPAVSRDSEQRLFFHRYSRPEADTVKELLDGLLDRPRRISPKYFYDSTGARLFDVITTLPEYYPTRLESAIYRENAGAMAEAVGAGKVLVEPGSGSSEKVGLLLDSLRPAAYVPLEIAETHLQMAARQLVDDFPWLTVHAVCADYSQGLQLPDALPDEARLVFFPGSTIGNFEPGEAVDFLHRLHRLCGPGGALLIGVDLVKDIAVLHDAYNDSSRVTAAFNLNVLENINRLGGGNFAVEDFRHVAFFNEEQSRIEMHLESNRDQEVRFAGRSLAFSEGERIHTENSYKYTIDGFRRLAASAGFEPMDSWCDPAGWFSVQLFRAV